MQALRGQFAGSKITVVVGVVVVAEAAELVVVGIKELCYTLHQTHLLSFRDGTVRRSEVPGHRSI